MPINRESAENGTHIPTTDVWKDEEVEQSQVMPVNRDSADDGTHIPTTDVWKDTEKDTEHEQSQVMPINRDSAEDIPTKDLWKDKEHEQSQVVPSNRDSMDDGTHTPTKDLWESKEHEQCRPIAPIATDIDVRIKIQDLLSLWKRNGFLSEIESHASSVEGYTVKYLANVLTAYEKTDHDYLQKLTDEELYKTTLAKFYAIFSWITSHISYDKNLEESGTVDHILRKRSTICSGYSKLFHAISQEAKLKSETISGHFKSFSEEMLNSAYYQSFTPNQSNSHAWNAVSVSTSLYVYGSVSILAI